MKCGQARRGRFCWCWSSLLREALFGTAVLWEGWLSCFHRSWQVPHQSGLKGQAGGMAGPK